MGLGPAAIKLMFELWQRRLLDEIDSVLDMGAQELHLDLEQLEKLISAAGIADYNRKTFASLGNYPSGLRCSAKYFYELLGIREYACIDLSGEHDAMTMDLNMPLEDKRLWGKHDLVTDHGNNEHIFNVAEAYRTMHRFCKPRGLMIIMQVVYQTNGYYTFDLSFFEGLAAANNYKILFSSYIVCTGVGQQFHIPASRILLNTLDWTKLSELGICYVFQKQSDADFSLPYQGDYLADRMGCTALEMQFFPEPPSRTYLPVLEGEMSLSFNKLLRVFLRKSARRLKGALRKSL